LIFYFLNGIVLKLTNIKGILGLFTKQQILFYKGKNMLIVHYDPINGKSLPDQMVAREFEKDIAESIGNVHSVDIGVELYINYLRIAVKQKRISKDDIQIMFDGEIIEINSSGCLSHWPKGFCDTIDETLMLLAGWQ
jgi:hypothetical protein